ncbi:MAG: AAA family ATPase [Candidatus Promineifilaceae bacterium]|nr:AAA family ATPase [Candidatus Promineifilaceae bacterium]
MSQLADPGRRLVTIIGLGGMGKTRLALDLAWRQTAGQYRDGVTFVPLRTLESARRLIPTIAYALHLTLEAADMNTAREMLLDYLQPKQLFLVFDNCEHLLPELQIISDILRTAPQIKILATSRERLRLSEEHVFTLQGVAFDGQFDHPAARLFVNAAQRIVPEFKVNQRNAHHVNRLCQMLNGMPLALELAAAWLDTILTETIVKEIEISLEFLAGNLANMAARHRSLHAVLETTWERLGKQTRQIFAALSVFQGSFSADAAEAIAGAALRSLRQLVSHSLLQFDREADRYQLHDMMRQFAAGKLTSTPVLERDVRRQHFIYYNNLAQRDGVALRGGDQVQAMERLELEHSNIHQAINWAVKNDIEAAASLIVSLHVFWITKGLNQEAIQQCEQLMTYRDCLSSEIQPWLLAVFAEALVMLGYAKESVFLAHEALQMFTEQDDDTGCTFIFTLLSMAARGLSADIDTSVRIAEVGLHYALVRQSSAYYSSLLLESLSDSLIRSGRFDEADAAIKQGYQLCVRRDDRMCANYFLAQMSFLAIMRGQLSDARRFGKECLSSSRQLKMLVSEFIALSFLSIIACEEGDFDLAEQYITDGLALAREANYQFYLAGFVLDKGDILMAKDHFPEALPYLQEAAARFQEIEDQVAIAAVIKSLSKWTWNNSKYGTSSVRWLACAVARQEQQILTPYANSWLADFKEDLEADLGEEAFARAWAEGLKLSAEEAMEEISLALVQEAGW